MDCGWDDIGNWESLGLDIHRFVGLEPRALDVEVRHSMSLGSLAESLLESLRSLDVSMDKKRIETIRVAIQNQWLEEDRLKEISTEIGRLNHRQASHRTMLISTANIINMNKVSF